MDHRSPAKSITIDILTIGSEQLMDNPRFNTRKQALVFGRLQRNSIAYKPGDRTLLSAETAQRRI
jgi:hypothetical protein